MNNLSINPEQDLEQPVAPLPQKINPLFIINGLFIIAIILTGGIFIGRYLNSSQNIPVKEVIPTPTLYPSPTVTSIPDPTASWKTYTNPQYKFEFKYPPDIFIKTDLSEPELIIKLSSDQSFDLYKMGALMIKVYPGDIDRFTRKDNLKDADTPIQNILNDELGYSSLKKKWGEKVKGNFWGDTPWSYYQIYIPHPDNSSGISYYIKTDKSDDPGYGGTSSQITTASQILSTFRFLDNKQNLEQSCLERGGRWIAQYNECESESSPNLTAEWCTSKDGKFEGCSSACRHDPDVIAGRSYCVDVCVKVCKFN